MGLRLLSTVPAFLPVNVTTPVAVVTVNGKQTSALKDAATAVAIAVAVSPLRIRVEVFQRPSPMKRSMRPSLVAGPVNVNVYVALAVAPISASLRGKA